MTGFLDYLGQQQGAMPTGGEDSRQMGPQPMGQPGVSDSGGLSAGQGGGIGKKFLELLPILATVGGGIFALKNGGLGDAAVEFGKGFLNTKLDNAMTNRKRKMEQEDFFIKNAYKDVDELMGADLSGIQVPDMVKTRLAELHQKANEARMNDGVISAKEAQELAALAGPIKVALQEAKTQQATPEFQARQKEKGLLAGFMQRAEQMPGEESAPGFVGPPEPRENLGQRMYQQHIEDSQMVDTPFGRMKPRDAAAASAKNEQLALGKERMKAAWARLAQGNSQFQQRMSTMLQTQDARTVNNFIEDLESSAQRLAQANALAKGTPMEGPAWEASLQAAREQVAAGGRAGGPVMPSTGQRGGAGAPKPKAAGARKVVRDASGNLVLQ